MIKEIRAIIKAINVHPLAGRHRLRAYGKFFRWQLSQSLFPGIRKMPFAGGTFLPAKKGMSGATGNIYCGLHEFEDMGFLLHFLRPGDVFIDAGANIGSYSVLASGVCKAVSVSFEPVPATFAHLQNSIRVNGIEHLTELHNAAAGEAEGNIKFTSGLDTVNHVLSKEEANDSGAIEVPVVPLDTLLTGRKNTRLIKIDTEGFETAVIEGMPLLLNNPELKAIIIELNGSGARYGYDEKEIHRKLLLHNFMPFSYDPFSRQLKALTSFSSLNTIYLRDMDFVKERLSTAKKIKLFSESF